MRSFLTRLLVAVIAIPALLFVFHRGGEWLRLLVVLLIVLGMVEAQRLSQKAGARYHLVPSILLALLIPWVSSDVLPQISWPIWLIVILIMAAIPIVRATDIRKTAGSTCAQIATVFWVAVGLGALIPLRGSLEGMGYWWLVFLFANLWIGDTAAYAFGVWLGEAKLSAVVSPRKTIVGSIAQVVASAVVGTVFALAGWIDASVVLLISASVTIGVVGQIGDLFESVLKRAAGEKDSSTLIPGHGGVLDRFDSAMLAAPALFAMLQLWPR